MTDYPQSGKNQSDEQGANPNLLISLYNWVSKVWIFYYPRFLAEIIAVFYSKTFTCGCTSIVKAGQ